MTLTKIHPLKVERPIVKCVGEPPFNSLWLYVSNDDVSTLLAALQSESKRVASVAMAESRIPFATYNTNHKCKYKYKRLLVQQ
jgi:hypothetical protein